MTDPAPATSRSTRRIALGALAVAALFLVGFGAWSYTCPCERTPGGYLFGSGPEIPVTDWSFANAAPLCQIQVSAGIVPYSINLNCMATPAGDLYLSCGGCDGKRWSHVVLDDGAIRIRIDETVYPVLATRVVGSQELDRAWTARSAKLLALSSSTNPSPGNAEPRPDDWWSFRVESR